MACMVMVVYHLRGNGYCLSFSCLLSKITAIFCLFCICGRCLIFRLVVAKGMLGILGLYHLMSTDNLDMIIALLGSLKIYLLLLKSSKLIFLLLTFEQSN